MNRIPQRSRFRITQSFIIDRGHEEGIGCVEPIQPECENAVRSGRKCPADTVERKEVSRDKSVGIGPPPVNVLLAHRTAELTVGIEGEKRLRRLVRKRFVRMPLGTTSKKKNHNQYDYGPDQECIKLSKMSHVRQLNCPAFRGPAPRDRTTGGTTPAKWQKGSSRFQPTTRPRQ